MSKVAFCKVKKKSRIGVFETVWRAMELADWDKYVKGKKIFLKVNAMSNQVVPGQCTSPWVVEAVLIKLRKELPDAQITMGDADLAAAEHLDEAIQAWGFKQLGEKYGAPFINLSKDKMVKVKVGGKVFKELDLPKTVVDADVIITLPILKTHCLTRLTGGLKNQWGIVPRVRHQYHTRANQCIADINAYLKKIQFVVMDVTMVMEGNAPRTGIPKQCDLVMASHDRVAIDTAGSKFMGLPTDDNPMLIKAQEMGVGEMKYEIIGDKFYVNPFKPPKANSQPIFLLEMSLRKVPGLKWLIFDTPIFKIPAWGATVYNTVVWYNLHGKKYAKDVCQNSWLKTLYRPLCRRGGLKV